MPCSTQVLYAEHADKKSGVGGGVGDRVGGGVGCGVVAMTELTIPSQHARRSPKPLKHVISIRTNKHMHSSKRLAFLFLTLSGWTTLSR